VCVFIRGGGGGGYSLVRAVRAGMCDVYFLGGEAREIE